MQTLRPFWWLLPALLFASGAGQPDVSYRVQPGSFFRIDGTSTLGTYKCEAGQVVGSGRVHAEPPVRVAASVSVPVLAFDCGRSAMNRDFYNALKAEEHPAIRITITAARLVEQPDSSAWVPIEARGTLQLAGRERPITLHAEGRRLSETAVRMRGVHALKMSDYGVKPPSGLMGLVRAHDALVASFDLVAARAE